MLELNLLEATIVACNAGALVLDAWSPPADLFVARVARNEAWVVGARSGRNSLLGLVAQSLHAAAPDALVVDQTDGWTVWSLGGTRAPHALARLTVIRLDGHGATFHQGAVAGVPAKVLSTSAGYAVFVPAPVGHHLRDRVLEACADLHPTIGAARTFEGPRG